MVFLSSATISVGGVNYFYKDMFGGDGIKQVFGLRFNCRAPVTNVEEQGPILEHLIELTHAKNKLEEKIASAKIANCTTVYTEYVNEMHNDWTPGG